jgi:hypothetical protein
LGRGCGKYYRLKINEFLRGRASGLFFIYLHFLLSAGAAGSDVETEVTLIDCCFVVVGKELLFC